MSFGIHLSSNIHHTNQTSIRIILRSKLKDFLLYAIQLGWEQINWDFQISIEVINLLTPELVKQISILYINQDFLAIS